MASPLIGGAAARAARRLAVPLAREAYRRWQALSPEEKERYRATVRDVAQRGRDSLAQAQKRRRPPGSASG